VLAEVGSMPANKRTTSAREAYQQAVIMLLGARRQKAQLGTLDFVTQHATLVGLVKQRWSALGDVEGLRRLTRS
jgi:hypothetical protein